MNASDYGGGTPVVDVWRRDVGLAVGHVELVPKLVSLPVRRHAGGDVELALAAKRSATLAPGESLATLRSFVAVHRGDHFETLRAYSGLMQAQGLGCPPRPGRGLRADLVRLGLRPRVHAAAGLRDAAGREAARLPLGHARRRLAGGRGRLGRPCRPSSPPATPT